MATLPSQATATHQGHTENHSTSSAMLQDIVIGLSDGLTVPFALAAGLSGAVTSSGLVITAGLAEMGLSEATRRQAVAELTADPEQWVKFMMKYELGLEEPDPRQAPKSAFTISGAYAVGGLIPLSAYFLTSTPAQGLEWSAAITLVCLLVFGFFKSRMTGQPPVAGAIKMAAVGALAAAAAFGVARLVQG